MRRFEARSLIAALALATSCAAHDAPRNAPESNTGIDTLNARIERSYRDKDPRSYAALFTDTAVFEWPAVPTVRGRPALQSMAGELWPPLPDLKLRFIVGTRRLAPNHATEIGAFEESWRDSTGAGGRSTGATSRCSRDSPMEAG